MTKDTPTDASEPARHHHQILHGERDSEDDRALPAGDFSSWLSGVERALDGTGESDVPCGGCTACCRSSQFVHIAPDETDTLDHIPGELLFPAPGRPAGHVLLGYDEHGACPMLDGDRCSIYEHRPRTCRTYDCRVIPAAGVDVDDDAKSAIAERARRWRFSHPSDADWIEHEAVKAAARFVVEHRDDALVGLVPSDPTQVAVLAIEVHDHFVRRDDETDELTAVRPEPAEIRVAITRLRTR